MNYRDYKAIMQDEQLSESQAVQDYLKKAIYWNEAIKNLDMYSAGTKERLTPIFTEYKIKNILDAIEIARFEKRIGARIIEEGNEYVEKTVKELVSNIKL